ncbi:MAG TPA: glycosyltransferase family 2 protein [Candidatus Binatia bacterium]|jgi:N-acetylglucosaminyl-diphospho-decaprenol L-rhamnosyltransferase|nr:glycosyltransferase family 2 protein [Candidatus Binatia bacterium]
MKLSIVIICWNDLKVIINCLKSIFDETANLDFEVIVSDNGSTDGSRDHIRQQFPKVRIVENGANLGFAKGNNAGIAVAKGEYILILNPDTIIHDRALEKLVAFAERHPDGGAFGCRVLNPDGSFQNPARPIPTVFGYLVAALRLQWLGHLSKVFESNVYPGWQGQNERPIGYQSGCCVLFRGELLRRLGSFDERFFYHFEESDLCFRVWKSGASVVFYPGAEITHLGGQSVGRFPIRFALETYRSGYRFFYKHFGTKGLLRLRKVYLLNLFLRFAGYKLLNCFRPTEALQNRLKMYQVVTRWNLRLNPVRFIQNGDEPDVGYEPLAPAPKMAESMVG